MEIENIVDEILEKTDLTEEEKEEYRQRIIAELWQYQES